MLTLEIQNPCQENLENMLPTERGKFCSLCQKTVVDFSIMSDEEIFEIMKQSKEKLCVQVLNSQLNRPILPAAPMLSQSYCIPFVHIAAGLLLVAACFTIVPVAHAQAAAISTEQRIPNTSSVKLLPSSTQGHTPNEVQSIKGRFIDPQNGAPIMGAQIVLYTLTHQYLALSNINGEFELTVPKKAINAKNLIRLDFKFINAEEINPLTRNYIAQDLILSNEEICFAIDFTPKRDSYNLGGMSYSRTFLSGNNLEGPYVRYKGKMISYHSFQRGLTGKKSRHGITPDTPYEFFSGKIAEALVGKVCREGLYVIQEDV